MKDERARKAMSFVESRAYCRSVGIPLLAGTAIASCCWITTLHATEGGGNNYPVGVNTLLSGIQPPPGNHTYLYLQEYWATTLEGNTAHRSTTLSDLSLHPQ